jgi:uncharacterized OsmC-like protein
MTPEQLKELYDRKASALSRRPFFARGSAQARVTLAHALTCEVEQGFHPPLRVDLPIDDGGTGTAPHPGDLMRASLGASLVLGYKVWAARLKVPIETVALEISCDYDTRGQLGIAADVPVGWVGVTIHVTITGPAAEADVRRVVETADRLSPMLANISRDVRRVHRLTVARSAPPDGTHSSVDRHALRSQGPEPK